MIMERLDGFTADGFGNVIPGDIVDGDVVRIDRKIEQRYYAPKAVPAPEPKVIALTDLERIEVKLNALAKSMGVDLAPALDAALLLAKAERDAIVATQG